MTELPRVAVLMGGPSSEHDISLKSGRGVVEALARRHWTAEAVEIPRTRSVEEVCSVVKTELKRLGTEVAFIALHGTFGEDGTIQQLCQQLQIAYTGSTAAASRLGMDKAASRQRFEQVGLTVPRWHSVDFTPGQSAVRIQPERFTYPVVVKPSSQGSSIGVSLVQRPETLQAALASAAQYGPHVLIEEFVVGRELTVGVLGDQALPVVEIKPHHMFFDFSAKYTAGSTEYLVPAPLPSRVAKAVQAAGLAAHRALGCRHLSRTDVILQADNTPVILEVNTIPGFTPTSLLPKAAGCIGISYDDLCEQLVKMAWQGSTRLARAAS
ncbi:MAG: D-alanine--D-alanine ligase [Candidatus Omnitrophica bacterium]|nr:D-alanine--D-alanine ligase [Candidatus Omnitrophota bacterium]